MNNTAISTLVDSIGTDLPEVAKKQLDGNVKSLSRVLEATRNNRKTDRALGVRQSNSSYGVVDSDSQMFTTISDMINGNNRDFAGFGTMLDNLYAKNKKYYTIIKDYEIMPILIPQINRVLNFLVNECLTPDIQNSTTFSIKYVDGSDESGIQKDIDKIKKEMKLDSILRDVYMNRYKLGHEYYMVQDYNATFNRMIQMLEKRAMGETAGPASPYDVFKSSTEALSETVDSISVHIPTRVYSKAKEKGRETIGGDDIIIENGSIDYSLDRLNIVVERSPVRRMLEEAYAEVLHEGYSRYSSKAFFGTDDGSSFEVALNEASVPMDTEKMTAVVKSMREKKLQRCTITRFDPAKMFRLRVGGKTIGYLYVTDIDEGTSNMVDFSQALKDQLLKTRATNLSAASKSAEEIIAKELAEKIISRFDPNLGISRVEDIDLLHDYIKNTEVYKGNKRVTFYYEDEIYDMSRTGDSILTNAVFFTKLYSTLLLNNVVTKIIRGRGRQIHTVKLGASPNVRRYLDNAMAALAMPETNLGTLHGSFEQVMNPFNGSSDIVIPTEEDQDRYITTDYIPGQDVDMNDEFLKNMLSNIVVSFDLDSSVLDATNGNLQFARTLAMESLQIANSVRNEQQDVHDPWEKMCFDVIRIMGNKDTVEALDAGKIKVEFYEPKTLIIQNTLDDINQAQAYAEKIADIIPELNLPDDPSSEIKRTLFIYTVIKATTNTDLGKYEEIMENTVLEQVGTTLHAAVYKIIQEYMDNIKEVDIGDPMLREDGGSDEDGLTDEEREIMGMSEDEDIE